ncbi:MAG: O-antigen ligase family protein [Balneolaceae bacterium]
MNGTENYLLAGMYQKLFLRPLGLNSDNSLVLWLLLIYGTVILGGLLLFNGDLPVVLVMVYFVSIALVSFLRIDYSIYTLVFLVLLFDQFGVPGFEPLTYHIDFFRNLKEVSYLPDIEGGVVNAIEIHLLFIIISLFLAMAVNKEFTWRPIPVKWPFVLFVIFSLFSLAYGMLGGGDFLAALWEIRAFFYFFTLYLIIPQIIRSRDQLQILIWIFIIALTFKALQGIARYISVGFTTGLHATLTNHEDPVFIVTLFILLFGFLVFKVRNKQHFWLLILLLPLMLGFYFALRRAAYAAFMVSFVTFIVVLPGVIRWKFIKIMLPCLLIAGIYTAALWDSNARFTRPIQMVKSGLERPEIDDNSEDYYSNLYRENENYNLAQTVVNNPVTGIGFGKKYEQPVSLVDIRFPLRDYIPHNQIFWVIVKMGAVGFFSFWFFFNSFVAKGVKIFKKQTDPYLQAVTIFIVVAVINQMVVSYFDLQLTYYRNMIYLGCLMGLLPTVEHLGKQDEG